MRGIKSIWLICLLFTAYSASGQADDSLHVDRKKLNALLIGSGALYTVSIIGLYELWYSESATTSFHFFDDSGQWKQMDKLGHFYASFNLSYGSSRGLQWAGVQKSKADLWGSFAGFMIMLPIEIMDGFSTDYGASATDLLANALGAGFYLGQTSVWNEVRLQPKFSFHRTGFPDLRDDRLLGTSTISQVVKDYNGQTYWLSVNMDRFIRFPKWLNLAVGYGAENMVYADDAQNTAAGYTAYRQYYLGIDFDLSHIKTRSKAANTLLFLVNMIRLPAPAVEFSENGTVFRMFQF